MRTDPAGGIGRSAYFDGSEVAHDNRREKVEPGSRRHWQHGSGQNGVISPLVRRYIIDLSGSVQFGNSCLTILLL